MPQAELSLDAERAVETLREADIVVGIPSFNNARTIAHVVRACYAGLTKYFPQYRCVVINSDGGSTDDTRQAVLSASVDDNSLMLVTTPLYPLHQLSFPYHGLPGKGSAFRLVFEMAKRLNARACAFVDADLRSIAPQWIDMLVRPILFADYDFVAPYYHRHKYDGTITNSIVYPLTRSLYGAQIRQPIGGDFGVSPRLTHRYLEKDVWETDVARFGIDIWMTTVAVAEGFNVCQSFLGAKLHDPKDPGSDLSTMLQQVVGSAFSLMREYVPVWKETKPSRTVPLFGLPFAVGLDPIQVDVQRMLDQLRHGAEELAEIWELALTPATLTDIRALAAERTPVGFRFDDTLWARTVIEFAVAYDTNPLLRSQLVRSMTPLYLGRVASFVLETQTLNSHEVEERIENTCLVFEEMKSYLITLWDKSVELPRALETEHA
jgi:hypothetical protein